MATPADVAIQFAAAQIGKPYVWGATGPNSYDCSGLVYAAYKHAGITLHRTTSGMVHDGQKVASEAELLPGDLRFPDAGHVQLYVGGGQIIESPTQGETVRQTNAWGKFYAGRRVTIPGADYTGNATPSYEDTSLASAVPGYDQIQGLYSAFTDIDKVTQNLAKPTTWIRVGCVIGGAILIYIGMVILVDKQLFKVAAPVTDALGVTSGGKMSVSKIKGKVMPKKGPSNNG